MVFIMPELVLYIIIAIIWAIIGLISRAAKEGNKNSKDIKKSVKKYQNKKLEDEEEIFRKLNKTINNEKEFDKPNPVKKENKVYETSYKDKEMLELQKKYDSIINDSRNITESINKIDFNLKKSDKKIETNNINNVLSSLNVRNAIIYNAILEPKRLNYKRIKKS